MLILLIIVLIFVLFLALSKSSNSQKNIIQEPENKLNYNEDKQSFRISEEVTTTPESGRIFITFCNTILSNTNYNLPLYEQYLFNVNHLKRTHYDASKKIFSTIEGILYCDWKVPFELSEYIKISKTTFEISELVSIDSKSLTLDFDLEIVIDYTKNYNETIKAIKKYQLENKDLRLEIIPAFNPQKSSNEIYYFESYDLEYIHELIEENGPWYLDEYISNYSNWFENNVLINLSDFEQIIFKKFFSFNPNFFKIDDNNVLIKISELEELADELEVTKSKLSIAIGKALHKVLSHPKVNLNYFIEEGFPDDVKFSETYSDGTTAKFTPRIIKTHYLEFIIEHDNLLIKSTPINIGVGASLHSLKIPTYLWGILRRIEPESKQSTQNLDDFLQGKFKNE